MMTESRYFVSYHNRTHGTGSVRYEDNSGEPYQSLEHAIADIKDSLNTSLRIWDVEYTYGVEYKFIKS